MFLFRKRKIVSETDAEQLEKEESIGPVNAADAEKKGKPVQISDEDVPVKIVVAAGSLREEVSPQPVQEKPPDFIKETMPEEAVDGLFVKVNQEKIENDQARTAFDRIVLSQNSEPQPQESPHTISEQTNEASGGDGKDKLLSNLFGNMEEEEETPLDRLIKILPDITIEEVLNEAEVVKGIMNEYIENQQK
jgi:hypothetical protein